jgi:hypothetical protein
MPEGDTIHRLAARLRPVLEGREVLSLRAQRIPDAVADEIVGRRVAAVVARGKNLLVRFSAPSGVGRLRRASGSAPLRGVGRLRRASGSAPLRGVGRLRRASGSSRTACCTFTCE